MEIETYSSYIDLKKERNGLDSQLQKILFELGKFK